MHKRMNRIKIPWKLSQVWLHVKKDWLAIDAQPSTQELEKEELRQAIRDTKYEIDIAYANFECAYNKELIEFYAYQIKAAQTQYNYLTKLAKEKNLLVS